MAKNKKEKPAYSALSNIVYLTKLQWKYGRLCFIFLVINIPISLSISFFGIYMPKLVIAEVTGNHNIMNIVLFGLFILGVNVIDKIKDTYQYYSASDYNQKIVLLKNEKDIYTDYENMESSKGRLLSQQADEALWMGLSSNLNAVTADTSYLITNILGYIIFGTVISFANPWIAVILTATALINYFMIKAIQKYQYIKRTENADIERKSWYLANHTGNFDSVKDIRIYGMATWFMNMFKSLTKQKLKIEASIAKRYFGVNVIDAVIILLRDGIAYALLINMVFKGNIEVDMFILCFGAVSGFADKIGRVFNGFNSINEKSIIICDLRSYLNLPGKNNKSTGCELPDKNTPLEIELKNVSYRYESAENDTLKNISLKIKAGEKIAVVGLNGAGKTTLIKNICGLYNPTAGNIIVNEHDKNEYNIYDYYSMFSVVFQDFHFLPVSIADIVSCKTDEETDRNRVMECIRLAGLETKISTLEHGIDTKLNKQLNEDAIELSGGEKQKLLIARAIYKNAQILILDEPTSALDPIAENELYNRYNEITKNKTSIYISHRLSSTRFCDRIILIEDGDIKEIGTHDELMKQDGRYAYLFNIQSHYYKDDNGGE